MLAYTEQYTQSPGIGGISSNLPPHGGIASGFAAIPPPLASVGGTQSEQVFLLVVVVVVVCSWLLLFLILCLCLVCTIRVD
jgi:hypothetical protein